MQISILGRRSRRGFKTAALTGAMVAMSLVLAGPSAAQSDELEIDEISHSKNIKQVANIPRQAGPFEDAWHSDIAFWGDYAFQGSYAGFTIYDIKHPKKPEIVTQVSCPGGQGDVSVTEDGSLLFFSVDSARSDDSCTSTGSSPADPNAWEGIRIFDISDLNDPQYVKSVRTDCGSHTHTLVPGGEDEVYLYISSYGPAPFFPNCQPPHDSISIVEVPLDSPADAAVIAKPNLFPDGGAPGTAGCHDITVFPEEDLAAGACMGEGVLMDISDPVNPYVITHVVDSNFAFYHSATFNNDADGVIFTDELGGGIGARCNEETGPEHGADAIYDIVGEGDDRELVFRSYFKIPRHQQDVENCVAHNGSLIPVKNGDIMVQAWYQGGVSVVDFTDADNPVEIAYWERGPQNVDFIGGSWSAYWYNGFIYSSDITKGLDVLKITGHEGLSSANSVKLDVLNVQTQYRYSQ